MNGLDSFLRLPIPVQVILGVLAICHLVLMIWALVRLAKDNRTNVVGLPKFVWHLVILMISFIGPIAFLVMHTREIRELHQQDHYQQRTVSGATGADDVVRDLYGE